MKLQVAKVSNIPVYLSDNYFLFVFGMILYKLIFSGVAVALDTSLAIVALSAIVVMHEFGHALTAKHFGAKTDSITLYFFGGIAKINEYSWQKLIDKPRHSLLVWLAGPMTNIVLAGLIFLGMRSFVHHRDFIVSHQVIFAYLAWLFIMNLALAIFNLLPVFPMDGGGILYSVLRMITTKARAIRITSVVGIIGSIAFIVLAFKFKAIMLGLVGVMALLTCIQAPNNNFYKG
jgi:Zn-dependent protease